MIPFDFKDYVEVFWDEIKIELSKVFHVSRTPLDIRFQQDDIRNKIKL